jgi:hypothetical protein
LTKTAGIYYFRARAYKNTGYSPFSTVVQVTVTAPAIMEQTVYALIDNRLQNSSSIQSDANTVYPNGTLGVGTDFFYYIGGYEYLQVASLMKFNVQSTIAGKSILEAKLLLHEYILPADFIGIYRLAAISTSWNPSTVTWNIFMNQMGHYAASAVNFRAIATTDIPLELDVTAIVQKWANGEYSNYGFQIWDPSPINPGYESYQVTDFQSLEVYYDSAQRPKLYIRYQ